MWILCEKKSQVKCHVNARFTWCMTFSHEIHYSGTTRCVNVKVSSHYQVINTMQLTVISYCRNVLIRQDNIIPRWLNGHSKKLKLDLDVQLLHLLTAINVLFHQPLFLTISTDFCTLAEANKVFEHHDKTIALMNNSSD